MNLITPIVIIMIHHYY